MWRTQSTPLFIDLPNDFFIVKLERREEYEKALVDIPWMKGDNYLQVQRWRPNFNVENEKITMLPFWVRLLFSNLNIILGNGCIKQEIKLEK